MKSFTRMVLIAALIAAPVASFAQSSQPVSRAQVRAELAQLEKAGMTVTRNVDSAAFREAIKPAYVSYAKEFGADKIKQIQDVQ